MWKMCRINVAMQKIKTKPWAKKTNLVSRYWPSDFFFSLTLPQVKCVSEYIFLISKKQTNKQKKQESINAKETKERKENISLQSIKRVNLRPSGWRFFSSPSFPETRVFFGLGILVEMTWNSALFLYIYIFLYIFLLNIVTLKKI